MSMIDLDAAIAKVNERINACDREKAEWMAMRNQFEEAKQNATAILDDIAFEQYVTDVKAPIELDLSQDSIPDASETVLETAGKRLHVGRIHELLSKGGKITSRQSIVSSLRRDRSGRFRAYPRNIYGLAKWEAQQIA